MSTVFATPANNVSTTVGAGGYVAGSGSLTVASGDGALFPTLSGSNFCRITVIQQAFAYVPNAPLGSYTIMHVSSIAGDVLTIGSVLEGTSDRNYAAGDVVEIRVTAGTLSDVHTAVDNLQATPVVGTSLTLSDAVNVAVGTSTGSKIGTSTSQKLGFYNATPITQPSGNIMTALSNLGLVNSPTFIGWGFNNICDGRLTLSSGNPVIASASGTTLYFAPYKGNFISLYDGVSAWSTFSFTQLSAAVPGATGVYDVFVYNNAGTPALEIGSAWTSAGDGIPSGSAGVNGVRSTALVTQDGVYVKSGATTRRYVGTIAGVSGTSYSTVTYRAVWNYYNRLPATVSATEPAASWSYGTLDTWRPTNATTNTQVTVVKGLAEDVCDFVATTTFVPSAATASATVGIGYDVTNAVSGEVRGTSGFVASPARFQSVATWNAVLNIGRHNINGLEIVRGSAGSITFYGTATPYVDVTGLFGKIWC